VFSSCPPPQTATLLQGKTDLANVAESVEMRACWAVLVADQSLAEIPYSAAFVNGGPLSWIANNSRKPQRGQVPAWVIHASADWSDQHVDWSQEDVIKSLLPAFESIVGRRVRSPLHLAAHRWRYAIPREPLDDICLFDPTTNLGICGDWCGGSRFEAAFMSGVALAGTVLRRYTIDRAAYQPRQVQQPSLFAS
jgi:predicted NAD/FAD-dependent oxidoreductase